MGGLVSIDSWSCPSLMIIALAYCENRWTICSSISQHPTSLHSLLTALDRESPLVVWAWRDTRARGRGSWSGGSSVRLSQYCGKNLALAPLHSIQVKVPTGIYFINLLTLDFPFCPRRRYNCWPRENSRPFLENLLLFNIFMSLEHRDCQELDDLICVCKKM